MQDRIRIEGDPPQHRPRRARKCAAAASECRPSPSRPVATRASLRDGTLYLFGSTEPFDEPTLRELYPDHDAYTAAFKTATAEALAAGVLLPRQAESLIADADQAEIP